MRKKVLMASAAAGLAIVSVVAALYGSRALAKQPIISETELAMEPVADDNGFTVDVLIDGRKATEYAARGRRYIEALENAEYELRIHNPTGSRVAVALSVDGMNTIDARHTSAWDAHKWVIEPYGTISVRGWQMSSNNARRFYFTTERDSYGAKIGQTANLGLISAVFFRERNPIVITPVTPGRRGQNPTINKDEDRREGNAPSSAGESTRADSAKRSANAYPPPDRKSVV